MYLPDINVWLALVFEAHQHHGAALGWRNSVMSEPLYYCRMTQMGFLRLATNPKAFPDDAVSMGEAWKLYESMLADVNISLAAEPAEIESRWREYTQDETFSTKVWNDAYLAAFGLAGSLEVVTFDKGFAKFSNVACKILS